MSEPPCPWCGGERVHDPDLFDTTGYGCASCFHELGLQPAPIEARPQVIVLWLVSRR